MVEAVDLTPGVCSNATRPAGWSVPVQLITGWRGRSAVSGARGRQSRGDVKRHRSRRHHQSAM